jgi:protein-S-isoprenylcysteine O-methyltransferase Ste14
VPFALALVLNTVAPLPIAPQSPHATQRLLDMVGSVLVLGGGALGLWGMLSFYRARTALFPHQPASRLVVSGPFRLTRNPMYIALSAVHAGAALVLNQLWALLFLPISIALVRTIVIAREERYLRSAFGAEYENYMRRVRRWL